MSLSRNGSDFGRFGAVCGRLRFNWITAAARRRSPAITRETDIHHLAINGLHLTDKRAQVKLDDGDEPRIIINYTHTNLDPVCARNLPLKSD